VIRRFLSFLLLTWLVGFVLFVGLLPRPASDERTDGIIVVTGGPNRIERGVALLKQRRAKRMLVSGVDLAVRPREFLVQFDVSPRLFACCVDLGQEAVDTRSNGAEAAEWVKGRRYRSVRLVTTDWHMRRARFELEQALPASIRILPDAVRSDPDLRILLTEYHKYLLRRGAVLFGVG
jgi:uncharacterized SAM-binding protein YcdF (DUF218 family)